MREEEVADKSRNIHVILSQWQWCPAETFLRNLQEDRNWRTCCCRLRCI